VPDYGDLDDRGHVVYPHKPGRMFDCPACERGCHCSLGSTECVYEGVHVIRVTSERV
jgi:hypothetical protein